MSYFGEELVGTAAMRFYLLCKNHTPEFTASIFKLQKNGVYVLVGWLYVFIAQNICPGLPRSPVSEIRERNKAIK